MRVDAADDVNHRVDEDDDRLGIHGVLAAPDDRIDVQDDPAGGLLCRDAATPGQPLCGLGCESDELVLMTAAPLVERNGVAAPTMTSAQRPLQVDQPPGVFARR
jgi:hypothetical protein